MNRVTTELLAFYLLIAPAFVVVRYGLRHTYITALYMPKVATIYITFILLLLAFIRFPFGTRLQYFKELFIYLNTFVSWLCYPKFAHGKFQEISKHSAHGKIFAHNFVMWCKLNHTTPKYYLLL